MTVLVTGGAGYIGSHICVELLEQGYQVIVADSLINSSEEAIERVEKITGKRIFFYQANLCHKQDVAEIFDEEDIDAVIHVAGHRSIAQSVIDPLEYYYNDIAGTLVLCNAMRKHNVRKMIFSSSAMVYGDLEVDDMPLREKSPCGKVSSPYGRIKVALEQMMRDIHHADPEWNIVLLRYFNAIGAHPSGLIGDYPKMTPNNLVPYIGEVAVGRQKSVGIFGDDYPTPDGTGIRDYIHVVDVAKGHVAALKLMEQEPAVRTYNLGTGHGYSVFDVIHTYEKVCGVPIPYEIRQKRPGDIAVLYADPSKAERELGWKAEKTLEEMCADSYRWKSNSNGYKF